MSIRHNPEAFPRPASIGNNYVTGEEGVVVDPQKGMSLRDWFAGQALPRTVDNIQHWKNPADKCPRCEGCGKIADDDDGAPWTFWVNLPLQSSTAVLMGLVKPVTCPECQGTGETKEGTNP